MSNTCYNDITVITAAITEYNHTSHSLAHRRFHVTTNNVDSLNQNIWAAVSVSNELTKLKKSAFKWYKSMKRNSFFSDLIRLAEDSQLVCTLCVLSVFGSCCFYHMFTSCVCIWVSTWSLWSVFASFCWWRWRWLFPTVATCLRTLKLLSGENPKFQEWDKTCTVCFERLSVGRCGNKRFSPNSRVLKLLFFFKFNELVIFCDLLPVVHKDSCRLVWLHNLSHIFLVSLKQKTEKYCSFILVWIWIIWDWAYWEEAGRLDSDLIWGGSHLYGP